MSGSARPHARVLPRYFVSARHGTLVRVSGGTAWRPYGVQHAREVGSKLTACGLAALDWRIFWEMEFPGVSGESCPECMVAVSFTEQQRHIFSDLPTGAR